MLHKPWGGAVKASSIAKCHLTVGGVSRRFYIFPLMLLLFGLCLGLTCPPQAGAANPGDTYVFPAQSPVAPDGTSQQGGPPFLATSHCGRNMIPASGKQDSSSRT